MIWVEHGKYWVRHAGEVHGPYDWEFQATAKLQMLRAADMLGWPRA